MTYNFLYILNELIKHKELLDLELLKINVNNNDKINYDKLILIKNEHDILMNDYNKPK